MTGRVRHPWWKQRRSSVQHRLSAAYMDRWTLSHRSADLNAAVELSQRMVEESVEVDWLVHSDLGEQLYMRSQELHDPVDLNSAIRNTELAIESTPSDRRGFRARRTILLGRILLRRGTHIDIDRAVEILELAVADIERSPEYLRDDPDLLRYALASLQQSYASAYVKSYSDVDKQRLFAVADRLIADAPVEPGERRMQLFYCGMYLAEDAFSSPFLNEAIEMLETAYDEGHDLGIDAASASNLQVIRTFLSYALAARATKLSSVSDAARARGLALESLSAATLGDQMGTALLAVFSLTVLSSSIPDVTDPAELMAATDQVLAAIHEREEAVRSNVRLYSALLTSLYMTRYALTNDPAQLDLARAVWHDVLAAHDVAASIAFAAAAALGEAEIQERNWVAACDALERAVTISRELFALQTISEGKQRVLRTRQTIHVDAAYAVSRLGDNRRTVVLLEEGRSTVVSEVLARKFADLGALSIAGRDDLVRAFGTAAARLRAVEPIAGDPVRESIRSIAATVVSDRQQQKMPPTDEEFNARDLAHPESVFEKINLWS